MSVWHTPGGLSFFLAATLLCGASTALFVPGIRVGAQNPPEPVIVALGDSLTAGVGATEGNTYVDVLSRRAGVPIVNEGESGDRTNDALNRLDADVLSRNPDIVIVFLGGNDILQLVSIDDTIENLELIIARIKATNADVVLVGTHDTTFQRTREARFRELAHDTDVAYVPDALDGILGRSSLLSDPVHPNDAGYRIVADRIWKELRDVLNERYPEAPLTLTCDTDTDEVRTGDRVTWTAYSWGAGGETLRYRWETDGGDIAGSGATARATYNEEGSYTARVSAERNGSTLDEARCGTVITVTPQPLGGHCEVEASIRGGRGTSTARTIDVRWRVETQGGGTDKRYTWSGTDGLTGTSTEVRAAYDTAGMKQGRVSVTSGSRSLDLTCSVTLTDEMVRATTTRAMAGGCSVRPPAGYGYRGTTGWSATIRGGTRERTFAWELPGASTTADTMQNPRVTYAIPGIKTGTVRAATNAEELEASCQIALLEDPVGGRPGSGDSDGINGEGGDSDCFIATAAYGSPMEEEVVTLREFRDEHLLTNPAGRAFVKTYYATSPPIADMIRESESARAAVRIILTPIVSAVQFVDQE